MGNVTPGGAGGRWSPLSSISQPFPSKRMALVKPYFLKNQKKTLTAFSGQKRLKYFEKDILGKIAK